jgi:hypothetical protein
MDDHLATPMEAIAEYGRNAGMDHPDQAWLLHDWDVWVRNPFYSGPPVRHPESEEPDPDAADPGDRPFAVEIDDYIPF